MPTTLAETAAFVGAAAWLPQVGTWIYKAATRPRLTIITPKTAEIGFTSFGPIFNVNLALATDRKDIVLTKLSVLLEHENGDQREFTWRSMSETYSALRDQSGLTQGSVAKDQTAIALKVTTNNLVEKFFRFQEDEFEKRIHPVMGTAVRRKEFLEGKGGADYRDEFLRGMEFEELISAHKEMFWWRPGKYRVKLAAR
jgi:hypothetical protein